MYQPESYGWALLFMLVSMTCWGSWANTMKLAPRWPFQLFYWDYCGGVVLMSLAWGLTLGNLSGGATGFWANLQQADGRHVTFALLGGAVFNIANLLLVAAIELAGLAVAFPIGIGFALVVGVVLNYLLHPAGNPAMLFGGVALVVVAILLDALAYKRREGAHRKVSTKGILLSLACGVLMGTFYPLVVKAETGRHGLEPYTVAFCFSLGVLLCAIPVNALAMRYPITGGVAVTWAEYRRGRGVWHAIGLLGGAIWSTGMVLNLVAGAAHAVGPAVSYAIGQGATLISALWGVFVWREFAQAPAGARRLLPWMFACFVVGLCTVALAPLFP